MQDSEAEKLNESRFFMSIENLVSRIEYRESNLLC